MDRDRNAPFGSNARMGLHTQLDFGNTPSYGADGTEFPKGVFNNSPGNTNYNEGVANDLPIPIAEP